jgi:hypothetical protein
MVLRKGSLHECVLLDSQFTIESENAEVCTWGRRSYTDIYTQVSAVVFFHVYYKISNCNSVQLSIIASGLIYSAMVKGKREYNVIVVPSLSKENENAMSF